MTVLRVDVGTTGMKRGVFWEAEGDLAMLDGFSKTYSVRTYNDGLFSDIDPGLWQAALVEGCRHLLDWLGEIEVIALSGTTPGMTAMDREGRALSPAILMLDQRSRNQVERIIEAIGMDTLMKVTGNMPVAGGCSLASILWIKDNHPDLFTKTHVFGHSNTYMARWLTGRFAIDPSSASLSGLYNTHENNYRWNEDIARAFDLPVDKLPHVIASDKSAGPVAATIARELGLTREPPVGSVCLQSLKGA